MVRLDYEYRDEKVGVDKQKKDRQEKRKKWVWFTLNYTCDEPKNVQGVLFKTEMELVKVCERKKYVEQTILFALQISEI